MFSSVATNGEEPQHKKKKNRKASLILSSLPDDLVLSCLARVSRLYYPTLSLASKRFQSLLASPELYKVRSLLGRSENCLYVCLQFHPDYHLRCYTLCRIPDTRKKKKNRKKKQKKSSENLLVPIPSPQGDWAGVVAVGSSIYSIGGYINGNLSSNVSILDCRSHTWHQAPNVQVARASPKTIVIDGKIYVVGGPNMSDYNSDNWIEVFDPKTQIWSYVSNPGWKISGCRNICSAEIDGKICMYDGGGLTPPGDGVAYNPNDGTFEPIEWYMCQAWISRSHCVIDNVLFYYHPHKKEFRWFDTKVREWRKLEGLEGMPKRPKYSSVKVADYCGKMVVMWDKSSGCEKKVICCAVVALERRGGDEIWGTIEWFGVVLEVPRTCEVVHVLAATL